MTHGVIPEFWYCSAVSTPTTPGRAALALVICLIVTSWPFAAARLAGGAGVALASPLEDPTLGGAVFTGVTHPDATALYINPAALGLGTRGWHLQLDGSLRMDQYRVQRRRLLVPDGGAELGPQIAQATFSPAWGATAYSVGRGGAIAFTAGIPGKRIRLPKVPSIFTLGLADLETERELRWPDIPVNAPMTEAFLSGESDLGYHVLDGHHYQFVFLAVGGALHAGDSVNLGMSVFLLSSELELSFLRDTALEAGTDPDRGVGSDCGGVACGIENPEAAERYDISVATTSKLERQNFALNAGITVKVKRGWWVGFSYQSPPGVVSTRTLSGDVEVTTAPRDGGETLRGKAEVVFRVPQKFLLGVRGQILPGWDVIGSARWQTLSEHQVLDVRMFGGDLSEGNVPEWYPRYRGFRDVLTLETGVEAQEGSRVRVGARLRGETAAVAADALAPGQIAGANLGAVVGGQVRVLDYLVVGLSYGLTWFPGAEVIDSRYDPRDQIACRDSGFDLDACIAAGEGRAIPSAAGTYGRLQHAVRMSVRWDTP